jgi:hypothetical protein
MTEEVNNQDHLSNQSNIIEEKLTIPFEDSSKDFFTGLVETIKLVLLSPTHFFRDYKLDGALGRPILFAIILGWIAGIVEMIWGIVAQESIFSILSRYIPEMKDYTGGGLETMIPLAHYGHIIGFIITPFFIVIFLFLISGILHVFLMIVNGAHKNFETTCNVVAYGFATSVFKIIPFCGGIFSFIYSLIISIIGLTEAHKADSWKAVFAVLGPLVFCCGCCAVFALITGGIDFARFSGLNLWN